MGFPHRRGAEEEGRRGGTPRAAGSERGGSPGTAQGTRCRSWGRARARAAPGALAQTSLLRPPCVSLDVTVPQHRKRLLPEELPQSPTLLHCVSPSRLCSPFPQVLAPWPVPHSLTKTGLLWWQLLPADLEKICEDTQLHLMPPPSPVLSCGPSRILHRTKDPPFTFLPKPHPSGMSSLTF